MRRPLKIKTKELKKKKKKAKTVDGACDTAPSLTSYAGTHKYIPTHKTQKMAVTENSKGHELLQCQNTEPNSKMWQVKNLFMAGPIVQSPIKGE